MATIAYAAFVVLVIAAVAGVVLWLNPTPQMRANRALRRQNWNDGVERFKREKQAADEERDSVEALMSMARSKAAEALRLMEPDYPFMKSDPQGKAAWHIGMQYESRWWGSEESTLSWPIYMNAKGNIYATSSTGRHKLNSSGLRNALAGLDELIEQLRSRPSA